MVEDKMLQNKIIVMTGVTNEINRSIALELAKYNTKIILITSSKETVSDLALRINEMGSNAELFRLNTINETVIEELISNIKKRYGQIDIIVNSSGEFILGDFEHTPIDVYKHIINVNSNGTIQAVKSILFGVKKRSKATIINVASLVAATRIGVSSLLSEQVRDDLQYA